MNHPKGLANLGNTCYFNTAFQCILSCPSLFNSFINNYPYEDKVITQIKDVAVKIWIKAKCVRPYGLMESIRQIMGKGFNVRSENDLHEFINSVFDYLYETNKKNNNEIENDKFCGLVKSSIFCTHCCHVSSSQEHFTNIILSITDDQIQDTLELGQLISKYLSVEHISERSCDKCNKKCDALKQYSFSKIPEVLCFSIKRYTIYKKTRKNLNVPTKIAFKMNGKNHIYGLKSIACHIGNLNNGHYYCIYFNSETQEWFKIDDDHVTHITKPNSQHFYMTFYQFLNIE